MMERHSRRAERLGNGEQGALFFDGEHARLIGFLAGVCAHALWRHASYRWDAQRMFLFAVKTLAYAIIPAAFPRVRRARAEKRKTVELERNPVLTRHNSRVGWQADSTGPFRFRSYADYSEYLTHQTQKYREILDQGGLPVRVESFRDAHRDTANQPLALRSDAQGSGKRNRRPRINEAGMDLSSDQPAG
jgi:hypothetical protein